ncbi:hypothetical protein [Actinobacillus vicugnae]|uniref:hypothetical protein n=1 Tax=Actinobacillus vicugnae TaxID=2573093 RepID=UPI001242D5ED|nr:hypothetical protein [Actinobacillus vicugnae]
MKKLLIALLCVPSLSLAQVTGDSCSKIEDSTKRLECYDGVFMKKEQKANEENVEKVKWEYRQKRDELRDATTHTATLISSNTIDFGFPYNDSSMNLTLRQDPKYGNDVIFSVNGQFNGCMIESCKITVKFDSEKLESYRMVGSDGGDNSTLFIENPKSMKTFVEKLRKSNKLIVEASFYNYGKGQFTFATQGLEWKHF